jgi:hypothetical protein
MIFFAKIILILIILNSFLILGCSEKKKEYVRNYYIIDNQESTNSIESTGSTNNIDKSMVENETPQIV